MSKLSKDSRAKRKTWFVSVETDTKNSIRKKNNRKKNKSVQQQKSVQTNNQDLEKSKSNSLKITKNNKNKAPRKVLIPTKDRELTSEVLIISGMVPHEIANKLIKK